MQGVSFGNMQLLNLCFFMICFVFKKQQDNRVLEEIDRRLLIVLYTPCGIKDTKTVVLNYNYRGIPVVATPVSPTSISGYNIGWLWWSFYF